MRWWGSSTSSVLVAVLFGTATAVVAVRFCSAPAATGVDVALSSWWDETLVGQRVRLPSHDVDGRDTASAEIRKLVVLASCQSCSSDSSILDAPERWPQAVAIVWSGDPIPKRLLAAKGPIRIYRSNEVSLPGAMLRRLPQAASVDSQRRILAVPGRTQSLKEFVESP